MGPGRAELLLDRRFVGALGLLLANDWLFKAELGDGPLGLITGKLSDVAAMVVGPVLVAVVVPRLVRRHPLVALIPPAVLLAAINLSTGLARSYESLLGGVTGVEHRIVVDPLDLIGLAGLAVAARILAAPQPLAIRRRQILAIVIGVVAVGGAAASSQDDGPNRDRVTVDDGRIVASSSFYDAARVSVDDGLTWEPLTSPSAVDAEPTTERCLDADPDVCVRLPDRFTIEESRDGGRSWQRVWHTGDGSDRWLTTGDHGYQGTGSIELSDVAETATGAVVVAASAIDPIRRGPTGGWRPTVGDLRRFQSGSLVPLLLAVAFVMVGLAAIGSERQDRLLASATVGIGLTFIIPGIWLVAILAGVESLWLPAIASIIAVLAVLRWGGGRGAAGGLVGGLGVVLAAAGALMILAYFAFFEIILVLLVPAIPLGVVALGLVVAVLRRGGAARRLLARHIAACLVIVAVSAVPMAAWSTGWSDWETVNRLGPLIAIAGVGLIAALLRADLARPAAEEVGG